MQQRRRHYYNFEYHERIECLTFNGNTQAVSIILAAQFIFFNLHYAIGSSLTVCALVSWLSQIAISATEFHFLRANALGRLNYTLDVHFWLNRAFTLLYIPFLVWAVILMYERATTPP